MIAREWLKEFVEFAWVKCGSWSISHDKVRNGHPVEEVIVRDAHHSVPRHMSIADWTRVHVHGRAQFAPIAAAGGQNFNAIGDSQTRYFGLQRIYEGGRSATWRAVRTVANVNPKRRLVHVAAAAAMADSIKAKSSMPISCTLPWNASVQFAAGHLLT